MAHWKRIRLGTMRSWVRFLAQWVKDPALLWLWCGPVAIALIRPLAWEPPYALRVALKRKKKKLQHTVSLWPILFFKNIRRV